MLESSVALSSRTKHIEERADWGGFCDLSMFWKDSHTRGLVFTVSVLRVLGWFLGKKLK